jgi:hypothetical protein
VAPQLRAEARRAVLDALKEINIAEVFLEPQTDPVKVKQRIRNATGAATPRLLACGGAKRLLLLLQGGTNTEPLHELIRQEMNETSSVVFGADGHVVLCYEVERIPPGNVAGHLADNRHEYAGIASRLHTRVDVPWTPLVYGQ